MKGLKILLFLGAALAMSSVQVWTAEKGSEALASATNALKSFRLSDDLQVTLFAMDRIVGHPTHLDIDEQGRLWVTERGEDTSTSETGGTANSGPDRLVVLADSDRNGVADLHTTFYQDPSIQGARAICVLGNQVLVSSGRYVFVLRDKNRDGVADDRELLLMAAPGFDDAAGVDRIAFGADGKLYCAVGPGALPLRTPLDRSCPLHGPLPEKPSQPVGAHPGGQVPRTRSTAASGRLVVQCNLDGSDMETVAWAPGLGLDFTVDSFSGCWIAQTDTQGTSFTCSLGLGLNRDDSAAAEPGLARPILDVAHGWSSGLLVYEGKALPRRLWNQFFQCDTGLHQVRACQVRPDGSAYKAESEVILSSTDADFCPAGACMAPDGSIYFIDLGGVEGSQPNAAKSASAGGRIYRLARKGSKPNVPEQDWVSPHGWVGALQSPNLATRYLAWSKLNADSAGSERHLSTLSRALDPYYRARAYQLLARIKGAPDKQIGRCLADKSPDIRILGVRRARAQDRDIIPVIQKLLHDPSPAVRRECAMALRHSPAPEAPDLWAELACQHDSNDAWYLDALSIGADGQWDMFLEAWMARVGADWQSAAGCDIILRAHSINGLDLRRRLHLE